MPELPEVETTKNGLVPHIVNTQITEIQIRCRQLRWPIPMGLEQILISQTLHTVSRRGKYLLFKLDTGTLILHLGMSGSLCLLTKDELPKKHAHVDIRFSSNLILRYTDPRRFGLILWTEDNPLEHFLLKNLGVEPLSAEFTAAYLFHKAQNRRVAIKPFIMNSNIVVGVGNIYAAEALFLAGIHPCQPAGQLTLEQSALLTEAIKHILKKAIHQGGTTLKDFVNSDGKPGYFAQQLKVYGREGKPCFKCQQALQLCILGQRSTVFCQHCQKM